MIFLLYDYPFVPTKKKTKKEYREHFPKTLLKIDKKYNKRKMKLKIIFKYFLLDLKIDYC